MAAPRRAYVRARSHTAADIEARSQQLPPGDATKRVVDNSAARIGQGGPVFRLPNPRRSGPSVPSSWSGFDGEGEMRTSRIGVVVGVDGAGRTRRLNRITAGEPVTTISRSLPPAEAYAVVRSARTVTVVDDAHRLPPALLLAVADGARSGSPLLISRRPTITAPELADLDAVAATYGRIVELEPLTETETGRLIAEVTGSPVDLDRITAIHRTAAGLPVWVAALADNGDPAPIRARIARILGAPDSTLARVAAALTMDIDLADDLLARVAQAHDDEVVTAVHELAEAGLLAPGTERLVPLVAETCAAMIPPSQRRRLHRDAGSALSAVDPVRAAEHLRQAGATSADSANVYARAGERLRFIDPAAAIEWFDLAVATGADPVATTDARTHADVLLGNAVQIDGTLSTGYIAGVAAAHAGRPARAADALAASAPPGPLLGVVPLVTTGRIDEAHAVVRSTIAAAVSTYPRPPDPVPPGAHRLAEGALALVADPGTALPLLIEAAEIYEQAPLNAVFPDTPHAVAAVAAVTAGDVQTAEHLLVRAIDAATGGPAARDRHLLLLAWVRMRAGRYDTAREQLRRLGAASLPARERLVVAALAAGLARRSGEISQLREAWSRAQPALSRRTVDLLTAEITEELLVAATRLREHHRVEPLMDDLDTIVARLRRPAPWQATLAWIRLQIAIANDDAEAAAQAADQMPESAVLRQQAQQAAARVWADALAERVDATAILTAVDGLVAAHLPWEASRLCGHAAIRTRDAGDTRRLLERARDLSQTATSTGGAAAPTGGLSDREVEVARMVLAGQTYKVIGAQLFLSPKTVEHHVARIRAKMGAESRAEMVAALRELLGSADPIDGPPGGIPRSGTPAR